jgi:hypothetical protein
MAVPDLSLRVDWRVSEDAMISRVLSVLCARNRRLRGACGTFCYILYCNTHPTSEASQRHVYSNTCINLSELDLMNPTNSLDLVPDISFQRMTFDSNNWKFWFFLAQQDLQRPCPSRGIHRTSFYCCLIHKSRDTLHSFIIATGSPTISSRHQEPLTRSTSGSNRPPPKKTEKIVDDSEDYRAWETLN